MPDAAFRDANVYEITPHGNRFLCRAKITDGQIGLDLSAGQAVAILADHERYEKFAVLFYFTGTVNLPLSGGEVSR